MEFFSLFFILWWLELQTISAMVDFQSIQDGWLGEATLFPAEHNGNLNFDDLFNTPKGQDEGLLSDQWDGLQWLEENIKLSLEDEQKGLYFPPDETDGLNALINECVKTYPDLFDCVSEASVMQSDETEKEINNSLDGGFSSNLSSPESKYLPLSPQYEPVSEASSPASPVSDIPVDDTVYGFCLSPCSISNTSSNAPTVVSVTICDNADVELEDSELMTIEEVVSSVKEKKYMATSKSKVPKVQVSLKDAFHPYSRTKSRSKRRGSNDPFERKKVQNKEAAARYRIKKREEEEKLSGEVQDLEDQQKELKTKHDDILSEIKYLKSLMREMFQKKGLL